MNSDSQQDVRDLSVDELMEIYDDLRDEADHLPSDDPSCVEIELLWSVVHQTFDDEVSIE